MSKPMTDHKGNQFPSVEEMCRHWRIPITRYYSGIKKRQTLQEILTTKKQEQKEYKDHEGNTFASIDAMCRHWGTSDSTFSQRRKAGFTIEESLTFTKDQVKERTRGCRDHKGKLFPSQNAMCRHWKIDPHVYFGRLALGWDLKKILTTPVSRAAANATKIKDHNGKEFPSISAMCRHWGMTRSTYNARIRSGWTIKNALTTPKAAINVDAKESTDHTGKKFPSFNAMCRYWNTTKDVVSSRMEMGWSLERALTVPVSSPGTEITDYMGRQFPTLSDMCHFYGFRLHDLQGKEQNEATFLKAVRRRFGKKAEFGKTMVLKILQFPYFLTKTGKPEQILTIEDLLHIRHAHFKPFPESKVQDPRMAVIKQLMFPYYLVSFDGKEETWDYWKIINYRKQANYGMSAARVEASSEEKK